MRFKHFSQSAIEYLLIISLVIAILTPFIYYGYMTSQESTRVIQAKQAVQALAKAAEYVYSQGVGSRITVQVTIPGGVNYSGSYIGKPAWTGPSVPSKEINLRLQTRNGETDVFESTTPEVRGSWLGNPGNQLYIVQMTSDGYVLIIPYELEFDAIPSYFNENIQAGTSTQLNFTVISYSDYDLTINFTKTGDIASWITLSTNQTTLSSYSNKTIFFNITVPDNVDLGYYSGKIIAESGNTTREIIIELNVYSGNLTLPNYTITLYNDSSYSKEAYEFYQGKLVEIRGKNWPASSNLTISILDPLGYNVTGYPVVIQTDNEGSFVHYWDQSQVTTFGNYTVVVNNSEKTKTTVFEVRPCI